MRNSIIRLISVVSLSILFAGGVEARAQKFTFAVEHDHLFKPCKGVLTISAEGVLYETTDKEHAREWAYTDIQIIKLTSPKEISVLTYESKASRLGADENFKFKLLEGELTKQVSDFLLGRIEKPMVTIFVASGEKGKYEIPVRHRHRLSGCQGVLKIFADRLVYVSDKPENSRYWRWSDIRSISRDNPYQFTVTTYEPKSGGPTKNYSFDLREQIDEAFYDYLWTRVYKVRLPDSF